MLFGLDKVYQGLLGYISLEERAGINLYCMGMMIASTTNRNRRKDSKSLSNSSLWDIGLSVMCGLTVRVKAEVIIIVVVVVAAAALEPGGVVLAIE